MPKITTIADIEKLLQTTFKDISYKKSSDISILTEQSNKNTNALSEYNVKFEDEYIVIDKLEGKSHHFNVKKQHCFDYLCINTSEIVCIELKNQIGFTQLKDIPNQLYFGYLQTLPIMSISNINLIRYVVVYTSEYFTRSYPSQLRDATKKEDSVYVNHWNKELLIITEEYTPNIHCFPDGVIPINKQYICDQASIII